MNLPQEIEIKGMRVLTTKQLADAYGTDTDRIKLNYRYNKERFIEGKHIIPIKGEELRALKARYQFDTQFKYAKSLYLWTEKGALLHAKSLNTDKAWEVYDYLVEFYFRQQSSNIVRPAVQAAPAAVMNTPTNEEAQKLIAEMRKNLVGMEAVLDVCNCNLTEADYKKVTYVMQAIGCNIFHTAYAMSGLKCR